MTDDQRLMTQAERFARLTDTLSAEMAKELQAVLVEMDRALVRLVAQAKAGSRTATALAVRAGQLRSELRRLLTEAGYDEVVTRMTRKSLDRAVAELTANTRVGRAVRAFTTVDLTGLEALRMLRLGELLNQGDEVAISLWRTLVRGLYGQQPVSAIVEDLADALDIEITEARTLYDTSTAVFGREIEAMKARADGAFAYMGPVDAVMRPFCAQHIGRVYTRPEIDALDNGQLPDPFRTGGGYNCRHVWMAVSRLSELNDLVGTDQRAPVVAEALRDVQPVKRQKARAA